MNPFDLHQVYREAWATFEALRRLGFAADDIFTQVGGERDGSYQFCVILRAQHKEFRIDCGAIPEDPDAMEATWRRLCQAINDGRVSEADLARIWQDARANQQAAGLLAALSLKGFVFPRSTN